MQNFAIFCYYAVHYMQFVRKARMSVSLELAIILKLELWLGLGLGLGAWSVMLEIHVGSSGSSEAGASEPRG